VRWGVSEVGRPIPENVVFIEGSLEGYIKGVMIGICGATGTAVELAARGIPVVVVAEERVLTMHYLPGRSHPDLWRLCFSRDEIVEAVGDFHGKKTTASEKIIRSAAEFRRQYFAEPGERNWENYLTEEARNYDYVV
jgi:hypothetical protein